MSRRVTRQSCARVRFRLDRPFCRGPALFGKALVKSPKPGRGPASHRRIRSLHTRRSGMRRLLLGFLAPCALLAVLPGSPAAAYHVLIALSPAVIPPRGEGHAVGVVAEDG